MPVQVLYQSVVTTSETLDRNVPALAANQGPVVHNGFNTTLLMNATTTPTSEVAVHFEADMTAGAATIDLTDLSGINFGTVNLTGYRVHVLKVIAKGTNADPVVVANGATDGYRFAATHDWSHAVPPGGEVTVLCRGNGTIVTATNKTIDLSGVGTQGVKVHVTAGLASPA